MFQAEVVEKIKHIVPSITLFTKSFQRHWKNIVEPDRSQMIVL
jgi:hypothetical protein